MAIDFSFIDHDILGDIADAIRFVDGSITDIAPADYPQRIRALDKYIPDYDVLNFYMPNGGTISLNKTGSPTVVELEYWLDENKQWLIWQPDDDGNRSLTLTVGQRIYIRNTSETQTGFSTSNSSYYQFAFTDIVEAHGNTNNLLCKNADSVTTLSSFCYRYLFRNITSLVTAPKLPTTTIADSCYRAMFFNCTYLVTAPELPAIVLYDNCYRAMFQNCASLRTITTRMTDISATTCLYNWVSNVAATGDFYCPAELTIQTGGGGIPSGWTRHDI